MKNAYIDMHCDSLLSAAENHLEDIYDNPAGMVDIKRLRQESVLAQFFAIFFGSIIFLVGLPPHSVLVSYATLDRMEKQCCSFITDGEELKNNLSFLRRSTQCSIVFPSPQGQVPSGWLVYTSGSAA